MDGSLQAARPSHLAAADRTRLGAWYTPPALVDVLIEHALDPVLDRATPGQRLVIVDPACGTGNILRVAAAALERRGWSSEAAQQCLVGLDIDLEALAVSRCHLPAANLTVADGASYELAADVVVGNPPFLSQMRRRTARASGGHGYADTAAIFLAHWCGQLRPGGRLAMVQPMSMLAAHDAGVLRRAVTDRASVEQIIAQTRAVFDAAVHTVVVVVDASRPDASDLPHRPTWSHLIAGQFGAAVPDMSGNEPLLGSIANATADFRDQFYGLVGSVSDSGDGPPLITSGLIGVGTHRWGERPVKFARGHYQAPRVDVDRLSAAMQQWAQRRLVPKVLVATQSKRLHAVADREGAWLPSVPVITVTPNNPGDIGVLDRIEAALLHPRATEWARATYLGAGLHPTAIKLSARQLLRMPLFT